MHKHIHTGEKESKMTVILHFCNNMVTSGFCSARHSAAKRHLLFIEIILNRKNPSTKSHWLKLMFCGSLLKDLLASYHVNMSKERESESVTNY
jgi:hypothetical protein